MEISIRFVGRLIVEMTITDSNTTIITDISDLNGKVSEELIYNLRNVADDLELHNKTK